MSEYSQSTSSGRACSYNTLGSFYGQNPTRALALGSQATYSNSMYAGSNTVNVQRLGNLTQAPVPSQALSANVIVPAFGGIGYNSPRMSTPSCTGYYTITTGYPNFPDTCGAFTSSLT